MGCSTFGWIFVLSTQTPLQSVCISWATAKEYAVTANSLITTIMFFIKAYRDVPAPARNNPVNGTGETQSSQEAEISPARNNQQDLISNRVKAVLSIGELNVASLSSLDNDPVYGPFLHQAPNWLTQKAKSSPKAIKMPAWLRCDACEFFFVQPFCLPCCNRIVCKHCMHILRRELYDSPDYLGRDYRRVPDSTIPCPLCKEELHGTQVDAWNNSMTRLLLQVTVRHNMPGAHELAFQPKEHAAVLAEEGSDAEEWYFTPPSSIAGEDVFEDCNVQVSSSEDENELLDIFLRRPSDSFTTGSENVKTSQPSQIPSVDKDSAVTLDPRPQPSELWWKTLPVLKYNTGQPIHRRIAKSPKQYPIKLNPPQKRTSPEITSEDPPSKRTRTISTTDISPLYHGITAESALGPWKTPFISQNLDDPVADKKDCLQPDILSDDHPFSIQNQFRMSTEFAPLWRSYYDDDATPVFCGEDTNVYATEGEESGLQDEDEESLSGWLRDFCFEDLALDDADSNTTFFERELASWSEKREKIPPTNPPYPRKPSEPTNTTPENKTTKLTHGLLTPPDSAATIQDDLLREYPSPTPSWESISSAPSSPIPVLKLDGRWSNAPVRDNVSSFQTDGGFLDGRVHSTSRVNSSIAPPLGTPTRNDHTRHNGGPISAQPQAEEEGGDYFNLQEQLNDRTIYNRTLDIQLNSLHGPDFPSSVSHSRGRVGRKEIPVLLDEDEGTSENSEFMEDEATVRAMENVNDMDGNEDTQGLKKKGEQNKGDLSHRTRESLALGLKRSTSTKKRRTSEQRPVWKA